MKRIYVVHHYTSRYVAGGTFAQVAKRLALNETVKLIGPGLVVKEEAP